MSHTTDTEICGNFVRTRVCAEDMRGLIVAEFPHQYNPNYRDDAQLFIAANDLLNVAYMVLETATDSTPKSLITAANNAIALSKG